MVCPSRCRRRSCRAVLTRPSSVSQRQDSVFVPRRPRALQELREGCARLLSSRLVPPFALPQGGNQTHPSCPGDGHHGVSPARVPQRPRESLPSEGRSVGGGGAADRVQPTAVVSRHTSGTNEKYVSFTVFPTASRLLLSFFFSPCRTSPGQRPTASGWFVNNKPPRACESPTLPQAGRWHKGRHLKPSPCPGRREAPCPGLSPPLQFQI